MIKDFLICSLLLLAAGLQLLAALGLVRFPKFIYRLQASSKASTLGLGLVLLATTLFFGTLEIAIKSLMSLLFLSLTSPAISTYLAQSYFSSRKDGFDSDSKDAYSTKV